MIKITIIMLLFFLTSCSLSGESQKINEKWDSSEYQWEKLTESEWEVSDPGHTSSWSLKWITK